MISNIVKIYDMQDRPCGTGIVISYNRILTSEHVVDEQYPYLIVWDNKKYQADIVLKNHYIAMLCVNNSDFETHYRSCGDKLFFSINEIWGNDSEWSVEGFITNSLGYHFLSGRKIAKKAGIKNTDCVLGPVEVGTVNNYKGLSGSPVIVNERAIGILQVQEYDLAGNLGLEFTSVHCFSSILPNESVKDNKYLENLREETISFCSEHIEKNKTSAKYIPDIYVEESDYKDNLRYFTEPLLFIHKVIEELKSFDFKDINSRLAARNQNLINFQGYPDVIEITSLRGVISQLKKDVDYALSAIKYLEEDKREQGISTEEVYISGGYTYYFVKWDLQDIYEQLHYFTYQMILLTRDAGQGKTNFLCDFTENYLLKKGIITLYYNAFEFCERPIETILRDLTCNGKYAQQYVKNVLMERWNSFLQPIMIIIDGLNENTTLNNFGNYMEESMKELLKIPFIKVIMTSRNELLNERFGGLTCDVLGNSFCLLNMLDRSVKFEERIFKGYLSYFDVDIVEDSLWDKTKNLLVSDTLLLRFFCQVNKGKRRVYVYDIYMYALFEKYYQEKKNEIIKSGIPGGDTLFQRLIDQVCEYMVANKAFNKIPKSVVNSTELQILDKLLETDVIFKEDSEMQRGLLNEITQVLSFTFDEFRDYCITRYLLSLNDIEDRFPSLWEEMSVEEWSILEGVQKYMFFLARTKYKKLLSLIKGASNYEYMYWNNVWSLEESDLFSEDIELWKEQFEQETRQRSQIASYLLGRHDRSYFKKVSIDLLYDILETTSYTLSKYDKLTKLLFARIERNKYKQEIRPAGCVYPCNKIVQRIQSGLEQKDHTINYYDLLKLTVYSFEMIPNQIAEVWIQAYVAEHDMVMFLLGEFASKKNSPIIEQTILEIIWKINEHYNENELDLLAAKIEDTVNFDRISADLATIWG